MNIIFVTPASDIRRNLLYRLGNFIYGHTNSVTGPLILGKILKDAGHQVSVYEELYQRIDLKKFDDADVVGIYTMTSNAPRAYRIADILRKKGKRIIIGGIHATVMPQEATEHADQVVTGEAEMIINDVINGKIRDRIVHAPLPINLDEIPFPDYSILKTPCKTANVLTTRGCPFDCSFCSTSRMFSPYRERSVDNVINELRYYKKLCFKYMNFEDDNFTANKKRAKAILRRMIDEGFVFRETFFFGRTDLADDEELLCLMEKANLSRVLVGIESLNQKSLDSINKHQTISDIKKCAEALSRHKIRLIASLVLGMDDDNIDDIRQSVNFVRTIEAYQLQPAILTPFPGTRIYEKYKEEKRIINNDWQYYDMMNVNFIPKLIPPWELQKEFFKSLKRFYTLRSSFGIMKNFGIESGIRRILLFLVLRLGFIGIFFFAMIESDNFYRKLWKMKNKTKRLVREPKIGSVFYDFQNSKTQDVKNSPSVWPGYPDKTEDV